MAGRAGFLAVSPDLYYKGGRLVCIRAVIRDMMARTGPAFDDVETARTWLAGQPNCGQGWRHQSAAVQGHRVQRSRGHGCAPAHHRFLPHAPRGLIKQRMGGKVFTLAAARPWVVLKSMQCCVYCKSLVISCCTLLACAKAEMPVWLRISYFDMLEVADA